MASLRDRLIAYLSEHPEGADDDELAKQLGVSHRQAVNQACRSLAKASVVRRLLEPHQGKIVNYLVGDMPVVEAPSGQLPPVTTNDSPVVTSLIEFHEAADVRAIAYSGEERLSEDTVKDAVRAALEADGWSVTVHWGHVHGIDIEATRKGERLVVEAKGEGSLPPMRVNYFLGALGELLQRMHSPDPMYALALPAHRQFVTLLLGLPLWVRARLRLSAYLVRPAPGNGFEVGYLPPAEVDVPE